MVNAEFVRSSRFVPNARMRFDGEILAGRSDPNTRKPLRTAALLLFDKLCVPSPRRNETGRPMPTTVRLTNLLLVLADVAIGEDSYCSTKVTCEREFDSPAINRAAELLTDRFERLASPARSRPGSRRQRGPRPRAPGFPDHYAGSRTETTRPAWMRSMRQAR